MLHNIKNIKPIECRSPVAGRRLLSVLLVTGYWLLVTSSANASVLFFNPQNEIAVEEGQTVIVEARLDTEGKSVNALDVILGFPQNLLEVADVSRGDSIISLWIQDPRVDNIGGTVQFTGGIPNGGMFPAGLIGRVTFRAKATGIGLFQWSQTSQVLLNDGAGTPDEITVLETPVRIVLLSGSTPSISSQTHSDQTQWYRSPNVFLTWAWASDAVYSYSLDHDPSGVPDEVSDEPKGDLRFDGSIKYEGLQDGIYYFHLRQGKREGGSWSAVRTFRVQIDTAASERFEAELGADETVYDGRWFATFAGSDVLSGIARYDIREGSLDRVKGVHPPYELKNQEGGSVVNVYAIDKAGNEREVTLRVPSRPRSQKTIIVITITILALAAGMFIGWKLRKRHA
ncbi:MAG: hypothetical protein Q8Q39_05165 [bacterium]|nr:hypothetical protein [bacterium]